MLTLGDAGRLCLGLDVFLDLYDMRFGKLENVYTFRRRVGNCMRARESISCMGDVEKYSCGCAGDINRVARLGRMIRIK